MTSEGLADVIRKYYSDTVVLGYTERVEKLCPVTYSWLGRLWLAIRNKPTHHLIRNSGNCKFTVIHSNPIDKIGRLATLMEINSHRPAGITVDVEWIKYI